MMELDCGTLNRLVHGRLNLGTMPPLGGSQEPVGRLLGPCDLARTTPRPGDVFWDVGSELPPAHAAQEAYLRGFTGVVTTAEVEPWAGTFAVQVCDPLAALETLATKLLTTLPGPLVTVAGGHSGHLARQFLEHVLAAWSFRWSPPPATGPAAPLDPAVYLSFPLAAPEPSAATAAPPSADPLREHFEAPGANSELALAGAALLALINRAGGENCTIASWPRHLATDKKLTHILKSLLCHSTIASITSPVIGECHRDANAPNADWPGLVAVTGDTKSHSLTEHTFQVHLTRHKINGELTVRWETRSGHVTVELESCQYRLPRQTPPLSLIRTVPDNSPASAPRGTHSADASLASAVAHTHIVCTRLGLTPNEINTNLQLLARQLPQAA